MVCRNKYRSCAAAVCVDAGATAYVGGEIDSDGCSVRSAAVADAECESSEAEVMCGEYKCSFAPDATGNGCELNAGPTFNTECAQGLGCQEGICSAGGENEPAAAGFCYLQEKEGGAFCTCDFASKALDHMCM